MIVALILVVGLSAAAWAVWSRERRPDPECRMCGGTGLTIGMPPCPCVRGES